MKPAVKIPWGHEGRVSQLLGGSGGVVNALDLYPASLKSLGRFYFRCVRSSQWKAVIVNLRSLHCQKILGLFLLLLNSVVLRMYLWWSLCTLYLHACQVRVSEFLRSLLCLHCQEFGWAGGWGVTSSSVRVYSFEEVPFMHTHAR